MVGGLGRRRERRRLEAVGLAVEHQLEQHGIGRGERHVADALRHQARGGIGRGALGFGGHRGGKIVVAAGGDLGQQVVDGGEVVGGRGMRDRRPARAFAQGEAAQSLFFQELAACRHQGFAQFAVVVTP